MGNKQQISQNDVRVDPDFCNAILGVLKNAVVKVSHPTDKSGGL